MSKNIQEAFEGTRTAGIIAAGALDEVAIYDGTDAPDWANSREWYITCRYELEYNDPETACFLERPDY